MAMTFDEPSTGGTTFWSPFDGKLVTKVGEGTEGSVSRTNKNDIVVHEIHKTAVGGMITGGGLEKKEIAGRKFQEIQIVIDGDAMIQIPIMMLGDIAEYLPSINLSLPVKIGAYKTKKGNNGLNVSQEVDGRWVELKKHYTEWVQDEVTKKWSTILHNGMPEVTYDADDETWDFGPKEKFLKKEVRMFFDDVVNHLAQQATEPAPAPVEATPVDSADEGLPF